jgi:hypothetical protein
MKQFILRFSIFLVIPIILFGPIEFAIYKFKKDIFSEKNLENIFCQEANTYNWIEKIKSDSLIILSGSSSVRYGLSCNKLNNLSPNNYVNIAMDAGDPIRTYFILKKLNLKNVSNVYFGLDPWVYSKRYYRHRNKLMYLDFSFLEILKFSQEHDKSALIKRYKSFIGFITPFNFVNSESKNYSIPKDFGSVALEREASNFNDSPSDWFQIEKYGWSEIQFEYLQKISELCYSRKWNFSVFVPPKRFDYIKAYKKECKIIHKEYLERIDNTGFNSPIFGKFSEIDDFNAFSEAYHLNRKGQEKYSEIFFNLTKQSNRPFTKEYDWLRD